MLFSATTARIFRIRFLRSSAGISRACRIASTISSSLNGFTTMASVNSRDEPAKSLKINSWKMYPGSEIGGGAYWLDDEKVSYPFWEKTRKMGIRNL